MTDFVIVVLATATLAAPVPIIEQSQAVPTNAPTVGFKVYHEAVSCEQAMERLPASPGKRFVCVPVGEGDQELAVAY